VPACGHPRDYPRVLHGPHSVTGSAGTLRFLEQFERRGRNATRSPTRDEWLRAENISRELVATAPMATNWTI
jgi:hypothetical protein